VRARGADLSGLLALLPSWGTLKTLLIQRPGRLHVLTAKLAALGLVLIPFVLSLFVAGTIASLVIARIEHAPAGLPPAWLIVRALAAGWLILAVWAALECCSVSSPAARRWPSASASSTRS
jgi:hypothetical protein